MTWLANHRESEKLASNAELAWREGRHTEAQILYSRAAAAEDRALDALDPSKARTLGISAVSAASLYYKASEFMRAEQIAAHWLPRGIPGFAKDQLRTLLQSVWAEQVRDQSQAGFVPGQVLVSVRGGEVVQGGAPLDLITDKMRTIESIFHRTAEFLTGVAHRTRGQPSRIIQVSCRPWLFQAAAGSYQFAVAVQEQKQLGPVENPLQPERVADCFVTVLRAGVDVSDGRFAEVIPDSDYRNTFLKLTRNLAPQGKACESIEIGTAGEPNPVRLDAGVRKTLTRAIRNVGTDLEAEQQEALNGTLRALHLDNDWLELAVEGASQRVDGVGEQVDDVIGPMVNKPVVVHVAVRRGKKNFLDIEPDD